MLPDSGSIEIMISTSCGWLSGLGCIWILFVCDSLESPVEVLSLTEQSILTDLRVDNLILRRFSLIKLTW
jgi:hypothetical protein